MSNSGKLWYVLSGSRGGARRASLLAELAEEPRNPNQLATDLNIDYSTVDTTSTSSSNTTWSKSSGKNTGRGMHHRRKRSGTGTKLNGSFERCRDEDGSLPSEFSTGQYAYPRRTARKPNFR